MAFDTNLGKVSSLVVWVLSIRLISVLFLNEPCWWMLVFEVENQKIVKALFVKIKATFISVSNKLGDFSKFCDYPISFDMEFPLPCC